MATGEETVVYILKILNDDSVFTVRKMFGEYALYAKGRVVALVCNEQLYVKVTAESIVLESLCEKDTPYPGAHSHYLVEESHMHTIDTLAAILIAIAENLPEKKGKRK